MVNWTIELTEFGLTFEPKRAIKGQALADFVAEMTPLTPKNLEWKVHIDVASSSSSTGAGVILEAPDGVVIEQAIKIYFKVTNNQAKYEALIVGLQLAHFLDAKQILIHNDSQLVVQQMNGEFEVKDSTIQKYVDKAKFILCHYIQTAKFVHVSRDQNSRADALAKLATKPNARGRALVI